MVICGRVQNGMIVLDSDVRLPEGQIVTVVVGSGPGIQDSRPHSVLDIPVVSVGAVLRPLTGEDDLLGEMLEGRP
jgi:hypothetical protein